MYVCVVKYIGEKYCCFGAKYGFIIIYIFVLIVLTFRKIGHALLVTKCTHQRISRTFKRNDYLYFVSKYELLNFFEMILSCHPDFKSVFFGCSQFKL